MSRTAPGRIAALDGWRGLAAIAVVVLHALGGSSLRDLPWVLGANVWVDFFFVLSGFVLATSIGRASGSVADAWAFVRRRCVRLLPTFHTALAGMVLVVLVAWLAERLVYGDSAALTGGEEPWRMIPAALLLAPLLAPSVGAIGWLYPGWSVAVELWVNVGLVAVSALLRRRVGLAGALVAAIGTAVVAVAYVRDPADGQSVGLYAVGRGMAGIGLGIALGRWSAARSHQGTAARRLARHDGTAATVALATVVAYGLWGNVVLVAAPYLLAFVVVQQASSSGPLARLMSTRLPQLLGALSYSVYLWHQPVLYAVREVTRLFTGLGGGSVPDAVALGTAGVTVALTLLVAVASRRWIERDGRPPTIATLPDSRLARGTPRGERSSPVRASRATEARPLTGPGLSCGVSDGSRRRATASR